MTDIDTLKIPYSDKWWCKWNRLSILGCGEKCDKFLDDDLTDDIKCVKRIYKEHSKLSGNGFNAWYVIDYNF